MITLISKGPRYDLYKVNATFYVLPKDADLTLDEVRATLIEDHMVIWQYRILPTDFQTAEEARQTYTEFFNNVPMMLEEFGQKFTIKDACANISGLEQEIADEIINGLTPYAACEEWDAIH